MNVHVIKSVPSNAPLILKVNRPLITSMIILILGHCGCYLQCDSSFLLVLTIGNVTDNSGGWFGLSSEQKKASVFFVVFNERELPAYLITIQIYNQHVENLAIIRDVSGVLTQCNKNMLQNITKISFALVN